MRGGDPELQAIPVRGCLSVAVGGPMRGPNPREGIHASPRITRVFAYDVCGNPRGLRAVWAVAGHRLFLAGRRYENLVLLNVKKYGAQYTKIAIGTFSSRLKN